MDAIQPLRDRLECDDGHFGRAIEAHWNVNRAHATTYEDRCVLPLARAGNDREPARGERPEAGQDDLSAVGVTADDEGHCER